MIVYYSFITEHIPPTLYSGRAPFTSFCSFLTKPKTSLVFRSGLSSLGDKVMLTAECSSWVGRPQKPTIAVSSWVKEGEEACYVVWDTRSCRLQSDPVGQHATWECREPDSGVVWSRPQPSAGGRRAVPSSGSGKPHRHLHPLCSSADRHLPSSHLIPRHHQNNPITYKYVCHPWSLGNRKQII